MEKIKDIQEIGSIGNYYGDLYVGRLHGKYYWSIRNFDGCMWEEISKSLYDELLKHEKKEWEDLIDETE